jgi:hypothetical protein
VTEIDLKLAAGAHDLLDRDLFSRIAIAETGRTLENPWRWVLPYQRRDLCLDTDSGLRLENELLMPGETRAVPIRARASGDTEPPDSAIVAHPEPLSAADEQALARAGPSNVRVKRVFVYEYHFLAAACETAAPPDVAVPASGGTP